MRQILRTYKRFALISFLIFSVVWNFVIGAIFSFDHQEVQALAVTWVGAAAGTWETAANWSSGVVPTIDDNVSITSSTANIVVTISSGQTALFNQLILGGDATYTAELILVGNLSTSGSALGNITVASKGIITQNNTTTQTIIGTLLVESGGVLTHTANTAAHLYEVDFSAATITLNAGGFVSSTGRGFVGGTLANNGSGPGGGIYNGGSDGGISTDAGSGGGHGGNGGYHKDGLGAGIGYCDVSSVSTLGSGGGGGGNATGGAGGGLIRLQASGTATINGTLSALGTDGGEDGARDAGGGAGGGIYVSANTIAGSPDSLSVVGGGSGNGNSGGAGGGGCILFSYVNTNSITSATMNGGVGYQNAGSGKFLYKKTGENGTLVVTGSSSDGAYTPQAVSSLTVDDLRLANSAIYTVTSSEALILSAASPFSSGDGTGKLIIESGGTFTPTSTVNFTIANATLQLSRNATFTSSSTLDIIIGNSGTFDLRNYTVSAPLTLDTLTIQSGGTMTHGANTTAQTHVVFVSATTVDIQSGGTVNVTGKGYTGGAALAAGNGPGAGVYATAEAGSGAGHGGAGGADANSDAGGAAYCVTTTPATIGSGGGGGGDAIGGAGGGLASFTTTGNLTVAGSIVASGSAGAAGGTGARDAGGGAGGAIKLYGVGSVTVSGSLTVNGGASGANGAQDGGGGGGGCTYIEYGSLTLSGSHSESGGTGSTAGSSGNYGAAALNGTPTVTSYISPSVARDGEGNVTVTTTVSDADNNTVSLYVDHSLDGGSTWASSSIMSASATSGSPSAGTGVITSISNTSGGNALTFVWSSFDDAVTSTSNVKLRITPFDGTISGTTVSSSLFTIDNIEPTVPGNLSASVTSTTSLTLGFGSVSSDTNFSEYKILYHTGSSFNLASSTAFSSSSDLNLGSVSFGGAATTTISGLTANTQYVFRTAVYDSYGNTNFSAASLAGYTAASTPSSVSGSLSGSAATISWSSNATSYYVENTTAGTNSGWTGATSYEFSGLVCGRTYSFTVKGRNGDLVETATASTSVTTATCPSSGFIPPPTPTPTPEPAPEPVAEPVIEAPVVDEPVVAEPEPEPVQEAKVVKPQEKSVEKAVVPPATTAEQVAPNTQGSDPAPIASAPGSTGVPISTVNLPEVGVKVVKFGEVLKVTNNRLVDLALDTTYPKVSIQDQSGKSIEQINADATIPWELNGEDGRKCITATFYDVNGNMAKQKVTCVDLDTIAPPPPQVNIVDTKISFEQQGKKVTVRGNGEPESVIELRIYRIGSLPKTAMNASSLWDMFIAPAYAATEGFFLTKTDANGKWSFTFPDIFEEGKYEIEAMAKDEAGNTSAPVKTSFLVAIETAEAVVQAVAEVINNPEVERINETYVAPAIVGVGVANVAATGSQLPQVLIYLKFLFTQPILLLRRRKHKTWGTVYNAFTKQPVDLATVRLVHHEQGNIIRSQVTDTQGRYYMFGEPGEYRLEVDKNGFGGISGIVKEKEEDGTYLRLYHGDPLKINSEHTEINYSIPLEPLGQDKPVEKLIRERAIQFVQHTISLAGVTATGVSFIISPELKVGLFFALHLVFYAISYKFTHIKLPESFGTVRAANNKKGLHNVVVRVFDSAYNKLVTTTLTDRKGRYAALVGPSVYYVAYEKPGYETKKSETIDYGSNKTQGMGGMIVRDEELPPFVAGKTSKETIVSLPTSEEKSPVAVVKNKLRASSAPLSAKSEKYTVMPTVEEKKPVVTQAKPVLDSTSMNVDMPILPKKKSKSDDDSIADDIIAQWKQNH